jgi:hypothetical protein
VKRLATMIAGYCSPAPVDASGPARTTWSGSNFTQEPSWGDRDEPPVPRPVALIDIARAKSELVAAVWILLSRNVAAADVAFLIQRVRLMLSPGMTVPTSKYSPRVSVDDQFSPSRLTRMSPLAARAAPVPGAIAIKKRSAVRTTEKLIKRDRDRRGTGRVIMDS